MVLVKIGKQGGRVVEYAVEHGAKVRDIMTKHGICKNENVSISLNGVQGNSSITEYVLHDKDVVMVSNSVAQMSIKIARIGESLTSLNIGVNTRVGDAIAMAGKVINLFSEEIWLHFEGVLSGRKVTTSAIAVANGIYVIEGIKNTLGHRISQIIKKHTGEYFDPMSGCITEIIFEASKSK